MCTHALLAYKVNQAHCPYAWMLQSLFFRQKYYSNTWIIPRRYLITYIYMCTHTILAYKMNQAHCPYATIIYNVLKYRNRCVFFRLGRVGFVGLWITWGSVITDTHAPALALRRLTPVWRTKSPRLGAVQSCNLDWPCQRCDSFNNKGVNSRLFILDHGRVQE